MNSKRLGERLNAFGLGVVMLIFSIPGLWVVLNAFRPNREILAKPAVWIPEELTLINFINMFGYGEMATIPVWSYFRNSLVISVTSTVIALLVGMMGGYAFARYRFRGKGSIFVGLMLSRAIPGISLSLPIFMLWSWIGLIDTPLGLIVIYVAMNIPFIVWLTDGYFRLVPYELFEAGVMDGCSRWQAFWLIEFPLAKSGLASAAIFAFLVSWNEFALATQLTRSTDSKTLTVGLMDFTAQFTIDWAGMCSMAVIIIIPAVLLTFLVQKHLISGLTFGGVKG